MAVVNMTPDSFSRDGRLSFSRDPLVHCRHILRLIKQGADIIDLGAESSRPGSRSVSIEEELARLVPTLSLLAKRTTVPISVDTYKPQVAKAALDHGACIINNIRGTQLERSLLKMIASYGASIVLMHMRGNPSTMQSQTRYKDLLAEVTKGLDCSIKKCLDAGISRDRIIIDPGIGFSKTPDQNLLIMDNLSYFHRLKCPVLIGPSRKSFIGHVINKEAKDRLMGTAAAVSVGIVRGAHIVRVHDVREMMDVVSVTDAILSA